MPDALQVVQQKPFVADSPVESFDLRIPLRLLRLDIFVRDSFGLTMEATGFS
jgi:hypothetical protein